MKTSPWMSGSRLLLLFLVFACLVYGPLYNAGFVTDFLGWLECHGNVPFWRAYECFGNRGLYYTSFIVLEFLTSFFGLHPLPWFMVWVGFHAINAWLLVDVLRKLAGAFQVEVSAWIPLLAGVLFLIHPWQTEVVAWKACMNYLTCCMLMLISLRATLLYLQSGQRKQQIISLLAFFGMLYALEYALFYPVILGLLLWCLSPQQVFLARLGKVLKFLLPFLLLTGIWFVSNKLLFGLWIGHYGAGTHASFPLFSSASTILKYLLKTFLLTRFLSFPSQTSIYNILDHWAFSVGFLVLFCALVLGTLVWISRLSSMQKFRLFLFVSGIILIIPVSNLYFYYLQYSENDRYTYLPLVFLMPWLLLVLWQSRIGKVAAGLYVIACLAGNVVMVRTWEHSTKAYWHHIHSFPEPVKPKVFLLNVPDNFKGTFMFRNIGKDSSFDEVLHHMRKSGYQGKIYDVFQYNMTSLSNDFIVTRESPSIIKVEFDQWGNWWWRNGVGGQNYRNEEYIVKEQGKWYTLEFLKPMEDAQVFYFTPDGWQEVK